MWKVVDKKVGSRKQCEIGWRFQDEVRFVLLVVKKAHVTFPGVDIIRPELGGHRWNLQYHVLDKLNETTNTLTLRSKASRLKWSCY